MLSEHLVGVERLELLLGRAEEHELLGENLVLAEAPQVGEGVEGEFLRGVFEGGDPLLDEGLKSEAGGVLESDVGKLPACAAQDGGVGVEAVQGDAPLLGAEQERFVEDAAGDEPLAPAEAVEDGVAVEGDDAGVAVVGLAEVADGGDERGGDERDGEDAAEHGREALHAVGLGVGPQVGGQQVEVGGDVAEGCGHEDIRDDGGLVRAHEAPRRCAEVEEDEQRDDGDDGVEEVEGDFVFPVDRAAGDDERGGPWRDGEAEQDEPRRPVEAAACAVDKPLHGACDGVEVARVGAVERPPRRQLEQVDAEKEHAEAEERAHGCGEDEARKPDIGVAPEHVEEEEAEEGQEVDEGGSLRHAGEVDERPEKGEGPGAVPHEEQDQLRGEEEPGDVERVHLRAGGRNPEREAEGEGEGGAEGAETRGGAGEARPFRVARGGQVADLRGLDDERQQSEHDAVAEPDGGGGEEDADPVRAQHHAGAGAGHEREEFLPQPVGGIEVGRRAEGGGGGRRGGAGEHVGLHGEPVHDEGQREERPRDPSGAQRLERRVEEGDVAVERRIRLLGIIGGGIVAGKAV